MTKLSQEWEFGANTFHVHCRIPPLPCYCELWLFPPQSIHIIMYEPKRLLHFIDMFFFLFTDIVREDSCVGSMHNSTTERFCIGSQGRPGLHAPFCFVFIFKISALRDCLNILEYSTMCWMICLLEFILHMDGFSGMAFQNTWSSHLLSSSSCGLTCTPLSPGRSLGLADDTERLGLLTEKHLNNSLLKITTEPKPGW